jgi:hypothetical protein
MPAFAHDVRDGTERAASIVFSRLGIDRVRVRSTGGCTECRIVAVIRFVATVYKESR